MTAPRVSIILLSFNDWKETLECLKSLANVTYPNLEVIAVDNGSTNPPLDQARAIRPDLTIIENGKNLGYAEGNNIGIRYAIEHGADYVLVQNNDTILAPDFLEALVQSAESNPSAAFVGPLVYHHSEPTVIQSAGGLMTRTWRAYHRGQNEQDAGQYSRVEPVAWVSGCSILGRSSALKKIGLLDPEFFIYSEELDWCIRAGEAGFQVLLVPQSKIWHKGVQRDYRPSPRVVYLSVRNELLLLKKHHAGVIPFTATWLRHLRTLSSYTLRPKWRHKKNDRNAIARALRDFVLGRYGPPPATF
jgi:GT2 family glycosyltransferase